MSAPAPSRPARRGVLGLIGAAALAALAAPRPARAEEKKRKVIAVRIEHRLVVAPKGAIRVKRGDVVELSFTTDEMVQLHLHGYDIELNVPPGKAGKMVFRARVAGRFPISSHGWGAHGHDALTYLEVLPR